MEKIKYHQNGIGNEYGADHMLTDNWNPDLNYGNEYADVHFRIEAEGYGYPTFSFTEEGRKAFYNEVYTALKPLGWNIENEGGNGYCMTVTHGNSHLYLHPQDFSGEVLKNDIKALAEALKKHNTFYLRWVDLYNTVYDISDKEYTEYLEAKDSEIRKKLFETAATTRTTKFFNAFDVARSIAGSFRLNRLGLNDGKNYGGGQTIDYILKVADTMIEEGYLKYFEENGCKYIRSLNKTEQKKLKLTIA